MRKRLLIGALALSLAASLAACSGTNGNAPAPESQGGNSQVQTQESKDSSKENENTSKESEEATTEPQGEKVSEAPTEKQTESQTEAPAIKAFNAKDLFDASSEEKITITEPSYCEGEKVIVYFEKGAVVPKNLVSRVETVMKTEEEFWNMNFDPTPFCESSGLIEFYFEDAFEGVGYSEDKVNLIILHEEDHPDIVEGANPNELMLFDTDFDAELANPGVIYHEFGHTLRMHQSPRIGQLLEEGVGVYTEWQISLKLNTPCWDMLQYIKDDGSDRLDFDALYADPEKYFCELNVAPRSAGQYHYQYGVRFITFLREAYGEDIVRKLSEAAVEKTFSEKDNDEIVSLVKSVTSEDVFTRFAAWEQTDWPKYEEEIRESLRPYGY